MAKAAEQMDIENIMLTLWIQPVAHTQILYNVHFYEAPRVVKFIEKENRMVVVNI